MARLRGFTLIELLVVVAIMVLLIAILMPSLARARSQARSVLCLSNLRQLSHGWHMYADDHDEVLLPGRYAKAPGGMSNPANWYKIANGLKYRPRWVATMGEYVGLPAFNFPRTDDDRQDYDARVYACPQVPEWIDERNYAYGYNHQFLGNARQTNGQFHNFPVNRSQIRSFGGTVMATDCMGTAAGFPASQRHPYNNDGKSYDELGNHGWTLDPPRLTDASDCGTGDEGSPRAAVDPRHAGKANVAFCDGHCEPQTPKELGYVIQQDGTYAKDDPNATNWLFSGTGRDDDPPDLPQ